MTLASYDLSLDSKLLPNHIGLVGNVHVAYMIFVFLTI